ncbi:hypothetical protein Maes01_02795 [Microbulbifer aestuariivivens]|uniref:YbbD head domain-containing protein n=1 Tax=Microbulbifer aestuariivivens TaxID=1908308 RepID=A0ABP9WVZ7_9GAMM
MLSLFLVGVVVLYLSVRFEITESSYDTYEEIASIPKIFESGWIPIWLPKTAFKIKESHDIDTNEAWIAFNFLSSDEFYKNCQVVKNKDISLPNKTQVSKFPNFVGDLVMAVKDNTLIFYRCDDSSNRVLAVDHENQRAFIWVNPFAN